MLGKCVFVDSPHLDGDAFRLRIGGSPPPPPIKTANNTWAKVWGLFRFYFLAADSDMEGSGTCLANQLTVVHHSSSNWLLILASSRVLARYHYRTRGQTAWTRDISSALSWTTVRMLRFWCFVVWGLTICSAHAASSNVCLTWDKLMITLLIQLI